MSNGCQTEISSFPIALIRTTQRSQRGGGGLEGAFGEHTCCPTGHRMADSFSNRLSSGDREASYQPTSSSRREPSCSLCQFMGSPLMSKRTEYGELSTLHVVEQLNRGMTGCLSILLILKKYMITLQVIYKYKKYLKKE